MTVHEQLIQNWDAYIKENARYEEKGIKASKVRARKALMELAKLAKDIAAGAVLFSAVISVLIASLIFAQKFYMIYCNNFSF